MQILAATIKPSSTEQLVEQFKINHNTMSKILMRMHRLGMIHRASWFRLKAHSRLLPVWAFGGAGDVPHPVREVPIKTAPNPMLILLATIIECLSDEDRTQSELAEELAMHVESAARYVALLRKCGLSHIRAWEKPAVGVPVARHTYGAGKDAKRPARLNARESQRKHGATYRAKVRHLELIAATAGAANRDTLAQAA